MSLLNKKAMKETILRVIKDKREGLNITRVSSEAIQHYEALLMSRIIQDVLSHPTKGKTFNADSHQELK